MSRPVRPQFQSPNDYSKSNSIALHNPFQAISEFPCLPSPSFSQMVRAPAPTTPVKTFLPSTSKKGPSNSYFTKPNTQHITYTRFFSKQDFNKLKDIVARFFPNGCLWYPEDPSKDQKFYELILVETNSIDLTHVPDKNDPTRVAYSKCSIKRVFKSDEWTFPFSEKSFSIAYKPRGFNYPDYKMAWFRMFFFRTFDHSWFFSFHPDFIKNAFPIWFLEWWTDFGPLPSILPQDVHDAYSYYIEKAPIEKFRIDMWFFAEFKVPWIFCWSFAFNQFHPVPRPMSIVREFKVKWWPNYSTEFCNLKVVKNFLNNGVKPKWEKPGTSDSSSEKKKKKIEKEEKPVKSKEAMSQKQMKIFQMFEDDPEFAKEYYQFIQQKKKNSDSENNQKKKDIDEVSSEASRSDYDEDQQYTQDPYDF